LDQPAQVARVKLEPSSQLSDVGAAIADLVENPRFAERTIPPEEVVFQGTGAFGNQAMKAPNLCDLMGFHSLTVVR
jgi:hypothetical protein